MKAKSFNELITVNKRATDRRPRQTGRRVPIKKSTTGSTIARGQIVYTK